MPYGKKKKSIVFGGGQRSSGVTRGQTLKTFLTWYLEVGSLINFILSMWMYGKRKNPRLFGGGKRSFGVTGGQTLKTFLRWYLEVESLDKFHILSMWMCYGQRENLSVFGGGQRSFEVTRGQTQKTFLTPYLKVGSLDFILGICGCFGKEKKPIICTCRRSKDHLGSPGVKNWKLNWKLKLKTFFAM